MFKKGFTIVELLIVIVVIAVLAAIALVSYNGVTGQSGISAVKGQLAQIATKAEAYRTQNSDAYAASLSAMGVTNSDVTYTGGSSSYCAQMTTNGTNYYVSNTQPTPVVGACTTYIQTVTSSNCPTALTMAVDARDNHSYWVKKLSDGKCWMLTNLAYAGGGTNTYGDTKSISNGTSDPSSTYTNAKYYIPPGSNVTTNPTTPSTSTTGIGQYGYLYNWCGAMGGQATAACANATTPTPNVSISVCPAGWIVPAGGDFYSLDAAVNGASTTTDAGIRTAWFGQYGGYWNAGNQGTVGSYWSSTQYTATNAYRFGFNSAYASWGDITYDKADGGFAVRCIAS